MSVFDGGLAMPVASLPECVAQHGVPSRAARNGTLDGLRGCLAAVVLAWHATDQTSLLFLIASQAAVCGFFVLSALVLTRAWDGRYPAFLLRRFVRLWPLYALSLGAAYVLARQQPVWSQFFWFPLMHPNDPGLVDRPAWSLCIEAWAMVVMPFFVWFAGKPFVFALAGIGACVLTVEINSLFFFSVFFVAGAWLSRFEFHFAPLEHWLPQWLGRISYPLYLSHWIVFRHLPGPIGVRIAVAFAAAQVLTWTIERWSIDLSRRAGKMRPGIGWLRAGV
jgi:peptidoglycan/LPS O-acetylase OafA/YrhL